MELLGFDLGIFGLYIFTKGIKPTLEFINRTTEKELVKLTNIKEIKMRYLGENVLRAETAPIVVSSVIKNHFGRIKI